MPKTRREKLAEADAKAMEAAIEGDFETLDKMGRVEAGKRVKGVHKLFSKFMKESGDPKEAAKAVSEAAVTETQGKKLTKASLVAANDAEKARLQQEADANTKEAERFAKASADCKAEGDRIQRELDAMENAGVKTDEALLLSWAEARDLRLGEPLWNLQPTEKMETYRGEVLFPRGAKGKLVALNAASHVCHSSGFDLYPNRRLLVQFQLYNPATKCTEPVNVDIYYKVLSQETPYQCMYAAADSWCRNWHRYHLHWSILTMCLRCWAWIRRARIRLGTHSVKSVAEPRPSKTDAVAAADHLWDHVTKLRRPFEPDDLLLTTFSAEYSMDHMLVPCRSLPADVDLVLRRWMYQRRVLISRAYTQSRRDPLSRGANFNTVLPVLQLWCDADPEDEDDMFEQFYEAAPMSGRFKSLQEFAKWWDENVRSMGAVDHLPDRACADRVDVRFTNEDCVGALSNAYDHGLGLGDDSCAQFHLGELIRAAETKNIVLKVDLALRV